MEIFVNYAPVIVVVLMFLLQERIVVTPEQMEKARVCKNSDDLIELANSEGVELTDDQLDAISGGTWYDCMNETW